jgi:hypothetical protein
MQLPGLNAHYCPEERHRALLQFTHATARNGAPMDSPQRY